MAEAIVGLAAAIESLRTELSGAILAGGGEGLLFELDPVELTVQTVITDEGNGKVGWKVLEFGASRESAVTHTLNLKLKPVWKRRDGTLVRDFLVASADDDGDVIGPV